MNVPTVVAFILYILGMMGIGLYFYRKTGSLSDYLLGGRKLGASVAALSAGASDMSGWLLLGLPGALYAGGLNHLWISVGLVIGAFLNWTLVAPRLRAITEKANDALTIPDYLAARFSDNTHLLRITASIVILLFFGVYTASGLVSGAILFEESFGIPYQSALWIGGLVIIAYTALGGYNAVSWTDFFQGLLMLLALLAVPVFVLVDMGGLGNVIDRIYSQRPEQVRLITDTPIGWASLLAWGLGYFGQPHILVRFMSVRSIDEIRPARSIAMSWMGLTLIGAMGTGFFGMAYLTHTLTNPETVFIVLTQELFNPWIAGILLAAIFAAIMSTVDSQLLVCSSAITGDLYKPFFRKDASSKELIWIGRLSVVVIAMGALLLASNRNSRVLELVAYAWAGFGAGFGPVLLLSLYWKKMTRNAALVGIISGALTVVVWKQCEGGLFDLYEIVPGFLLSFLSIIAVSLIEQKPPKGAELVAPPLEGLP